MSESVNSEMPEMGTQPLPQHEWLKNLVGTWTVNSDMTEPDGTAMEQAIGSETVREMGPLWIICEGGGSGGNFSWNYLMGLGFDVTFQEYRGFFVTNMSSHMWSYTGSLSEDGKTMTLSCVGPHMSEDRMVNYRDVHELVDANTRTLTSLAEDENGEWVAFMKSRLVRSQ